MRTAVRTAASTVALALALAGCGSSQEKETRATLDEVASCIPGRVVAPSTTPGTGDDTGQRTLREAFKAAERAGKLGRVDFAIRRFVDGGELRDAWGGPLLYVCPAPDSPTEFLLFSCGEDMKPWTKDDVKVTGPARPR